MNKALADFAQNPMEYDLSEMMDDEEIHEMARDVEALRKELYEAAGRNRDYHVKAEDVNLCSLTGRAPMAASPPTASQWRAARLATATVRSRTATGDSGWRFTAGDESEEYMDDPNNAGIYKLNTICNDDPDIISLLHTPRPLRLCPGREWRISAGSIGARRNGGA